METEPRKTTVIALTEAQRAAIERASGRPGYGALSAGILALLAYWQEHHPDSEAAPEPVAAE